MVIPNQLGTPEFDPRNAFVAFPVAAEAGFIDFGAISPNTPQEAAQAVANGYVPRSGGTVDFREEGIGAVDFQAYRLIGKGVIEVLPTPKSDVDHQTYRALAAGAFITFLPDGRFRIPVIKNSDQDYGWPSRYPRCRVGNIADPALLRLGLDAPEFEILDIEPNGIVKAQQRLTLVAF